MNSLYVAAISGENSKIPVPNQGENKEAIFGNVDDQLGLIKFEQKLVLEDELELLREISVIGAEMENFSHSVIWHLQQEVEFQSKVIESICAKFSKSIMTLSNEQHRHPPQRLEIHRKVNVSTECLAFLEIAIKCIAKFMLNSLPLLSEQKQHPNASCTPESPNLKWIINDNSKTMVIFSKLFHEIVISFPKLLKSSSVIRTLTLTMEFLALRDEYSHQRDSSIVTSLHDRVDRFVETLQELYKPQRQCASADSLGILSPDWEYDRFKFTRRPISIDLALIHIMRCELIIQCILQRMEEEFRPLSDILATMNSILKELRTYL